MHGDRLLDTVSEVHTHEKSRYNLQRKKAERLLYRNRPIRLSDLPKTTTQAEQDTSHTHTHTHTHTNRESQRNLIAIMRRCASL